MLCTLAIAWKKILPQTHWAILARVCATNIAMQYASPCSPPEFVRAFAAVGRKIEILAVEEAGKVRGYVASGTR